MATLPIQKPKIGDVLTLAENYSFTEPEVRAGAKVVVTSSRRDSSFRPGLRVTTQFPGRPEKLKLDANWYKEYASGNYVPSGMRIVETKHDAEEQPVLTGDERKLDALRKMLFASMQSTKQQVLGKPRATVMKQERRAIAVFMNELLGRKVTDLELHSVIEAIN